MLNVIIKLRYLIDVGLVSYYRMLGSRIYIRPMKSYVNLTPFTLRMYLETKFWIEVMSYYGTLYTQVHA